MVWYPVTLGTIGTQGFLMHERFQLTNYSNSETKGVKLLWSWHHSTYTISPQLFKMLLLPHTFMDLFETCTQCSPGSGPFGLFRNFCFRVPYGPYFLILWNSAKHFYRFSCTLLMVSHNDTPFVVPLGCSGILDPIPKMGPRVHLVKYCKMLSSSFLQLMLKELIAFHNKAWLVFYLW